MHASRDGRWATPFGRLVRQYGVKRLSRDLQVDSTCVYQWIRGYVSPRPPKALLIIELVRPLGNLRLREIYAQRISVRAREAEGEPIESAPTRGENVSIAGDAA